MCSLTLTTRQGFGMCGTGAQKIYSAVFIFDGHIDFIKQTKQRSFKTIFRPQGGFSCRPTEGAVKKNAKTKVED